MDEGLQKNKKVVYAVFSRQMSLIIGTLAQSRHLFSLTKQPSPETLTSTTLSH